MVFIIDDILLSPLMGLKWLGEQIKEQADNALCNEEEIRAKLEELTQRFDMGRVGEEEYLKEETQLLGRLEKARMMKSGKTS